MPQPSSSTGSRGRCIDTLRLSEAQRRKLLTELNRCATDIPPGRDIRAHPRIPFDTVAGVIMVLYPPDGPAMRYIVRPRNISRGGIGFLHGSYVHPFSRCGLVLRDKAGHPTVLWGQTVRCRHVRGHVHEVGVKFEQPIDITRFVGSCLRMDTGQQQSVEMPRLNGRLLYIDGSPEERELIRSHFEQLGLDLQVASDGREALRAADENGVDLILTELQLPTISGLDTIELLREQNYTGPVVALTADPDTSTHAQARSRGCDAILTKPCSMDQLMQEIARHLPAGSDKTETPGRPAPNEPDTSRSSA